MPAIAVDRMFVPMAVIVGDAKIATGANGAGTTSHLHWYGD